MFTAIALLFVGSAAHVAYVGSQGSVQVFRIENSPAGLQELTAKLEPVLHAARGKPVLCLGAAEGSSLSGPVFEQLASERQNIRRFMYAQPKYLLEAEAASLSSEDPATLLKVCQALFPSAKE
jgi:hypothetical protein